MRDACRRVTDFIDVQTKGEMKEEDDESQGEDCSSAKLAMPARCRRGGRRDRAARCEWKRMKARNLEAHGIEAKRVRARGVGVRRMKAQSQAVMERAREKATNCK